MKITSITDHHADAGWRMVSFLKITTDEGLVGWSEFAETRPAPGVVGVVRQLAAHFVGRDPCNTTVIHELLRTITRSTPGGLSAQACAAIENACLDIRGKAQSLPVYALLGGAARLELPLYWSHCGTLRVRHGKHLPPEFAQPLRSLDDVVALGRQVRSLGYKSLKTNVILFEKDGPRVHSPGFLETHAHWPDRLVDAAMLDAVVEHLSALRQGAGQDVAIKLDLNFNFRAPSVRALCRRLEPLGLDWVEVDVQWNGMVNAQKMAALADSYDVNVAAHNYHGHLSTLMGAHFCALVPNFQAMEYVVDEVPWMQDFLTHPLDVVDGVMKLPTRPGWGTDIDEAALKAHPVR
jgi:galactonate dehydratase